MGFSFMLLAVVSLLAVNMTSTRTTNFLGARIPIPELGLSLQLPRGTRLGTLVQTRRGPAHPFYFDVPERGELTLVVRSLEVGEGLDAADVCGMLLSDLNPRPGFWPLRFVRRKVHASKSTLGGLPAVEAIDDQASAMVRAAIRTTGLATAVTLSAGGQPLDESAYRAFERTCASLQFIESE